LDLEERIANSHVLINDEGEIVQIYDKIHLFDAPLGEFELSKKRIVWILERIIGKQK